jgi:hypothetical protein
LSYDNVNVADSETLRRRHQNGRVFDSAIDVSRVTLRQAVNEARLGATSA